MPQRTLEVRVLCARHIPDVDTVGSVDAYCIVRQGDAEVQRTDPVTSAEPRWDAQPCTVTDGTPGAVSLTLYDSNVVSDDANLGTAIVVSDWNEASALLQRQETTERWLELRREGQTFQPQVQIALKAIDFGREESSNEATDGTTRSVEVQVRHIDQLPAVDTFSASDAYVALSWGVNRARTETIHDNPRPKWGPEAQFKFTSSRDTDADDPLTVEVWDEDPGADTGVGVGTLNLKEVTPEGEWQHARVYCRNAEGQPWVPEVCLRVRVRGFAPPSVSEAVKNDRSLPTPTADKAQDSAQPEEDTTGTTSSEAQVNKSPSTAAKSEETSAAQAPAPNTEEGNHDDDDDFESDTEDASKSETTRQPTASKKDEPSAASKSDDSFDQQETKDADSAPETSSRDQPETLTKTPDPQTTQPQHQPAAPPQSNGNGETKQEAEPETKQKAEPETKDEAEPETKDEAEPETKQEAEPPAKHKKSEKKRRSSAEEDQRMVENNKGDGSRKQNPQQKQSTTGRHEPTAPKNPPPAKQRRRSTTVSSTPRQQQQPSEGVMPPKKPPVPRVQVKKDDATEGEPGPNTPRSFEQGEDVMRPAYRLLSTCPTAPATAMRFRREEPWAKVVAEYPDPARYYHEPTWRRPGPRMVAPTERLKPRVEPPVPEILDVRPPWTSRSVSMAFRPKESASVSTSGEPKPSSPGPGYYAPKNHSMAEDAGHRKAIGSTACTFGCPRRPIKFAEVPGPGTYVPTTDGALSAGGAGALSQGGLGGGSPRHVPGPLIAGRCVLPAPFPTPGPGEYRKPSDFDQDRPGATGLTIKGRLPHPMDARRADFEAAKTSCPRNTARTMRARPRLR